MTASQTHTRAEKSQGLGVFQIPTGDYHVESSDGKICYKVAINNGDKSCTCADFVSNSKKDVEFKCKHIIAALNANGNTQFAEGLDRAKPKLDERFKTSIQGKEFVLYSGLLDLAHQKGLQKIHVEVLQYPNKENGAEAICRASVESRSGEIFIDFGDASPKNTNQKIVNHILRMASTRAKARALRDFTNIGMTCLEELGDIDEVLPEEKNGNGKQKKASSNRKAEEPQTKPSDEQPQPPKDEPKENTSPAASSGDNQETARQETGPKPSTAQLKAIENLSRRRNISSDELDEMVQQHFGTALSNLNSSEASSFIRILQQSA